MKEITDLRRAAERQGWSVRIGGSGHVKFQAPTGPPVFGSCTPSDWRALHKLRADLRRAGLALP